MRLYLTSTGEWTGNQSDAAGLVRANGGTWEQIDVPTDKPGLIAWLTQQWTRFPTIAEPSAPLTAPTQTDAQRAESPRPLSIQDANPHFQLSHPPVPAGTLPLSFHPT